MARTDFIGIAALRRPLATFAAMSNTRSSAVTEKPRDALCPSIVSFSSVISVIPAARSFIVLILASDLSLRYTIKCCSVVFGVTLRLLVINTSPLSPVKNKCHQQVSSTCLGPSQLCVLHLAVEPFTARAGAR